MLVTCVSCKAETAEPYKVKDYLDDLSYISGIGISDDFEEDLEDLKEWEIIDEEDERQLKICLVKKIPMNIFPKNIKRKRL